MPQEYDPTNPVAVPFALDAESAQAWLDGENPSEEWKTSLVAAQPLDAQAEIAALIGLEWEVAEVEAEADAEAGTYEDLTVEELKTEIRNRNENADEDAEPMTLSGTKDELITRLEEDDARSLEVDAG